MTVLTTEHPTLRVDVLGPLALTVEGRSIAVPGSKRRATLALLALADGTRVPTSELIDALWPDRLPDRARGALQSHMSRVRGHLDVAAGRLVVADGGYRLLLEPGELDVHVARDRLETARRVAADDPGAAADHLAEARRLWRGRPLSEFDDVLALAGHAVVLDQLRQDVDVLLVRCALDAGDAERALTVATQAAADDPRSEVCVRLRVEALAATGDRTGALRVAAELRQRLRDELGIDASAEFRELERTVAAGTTPGLHTAPSTSSPPEADTSRIPLHPTPLLGRTSEVGALRRLLDSERFVSIVGAGGVGKTRLAADVARRHDGETHWVSLAPVSDAADIPHVLAAALGLDAVRGDVLAACTALLGVRPALLVLDNCEHLLAAASDLVARLLGSCASLTVLTTSRHRFGTGDECTFRLSALPLPEPSAGRAVDAPALALFIDRARRVRPGIELGDDDLSAAVAIVRRLGGMPLAIELAAGRLTTLSVSDLRDRLDRVLDLLDGRRGSADARHETLRATLAWSHDLLASDRQRLLRHLAVFPDGVDLATAERVAGDVGTDGDPVAAIADLVDACLIDAELDGRPRYRMLETLRAFALERLEAAGEREWAERHLLRWAEDLTAWVDATLHTPDEAAADATLRRELTNLRAAWALAMQRGALDTAVSVIAALDDAAQWRELPEVWGWAQSLVDHPGLAEHPRRAAVLATASDFAWLRGDLVGAMELADQAMDCAVDDDGRARALQAGSVARLSRGEFRESADLALEAASISDRPEHSRLVAALATAYAGDLTRAAAINATALPPGGLTQQAEWEYTAGELAAIAGRHEEADRHYRRAIEVASEVGSSFVVGIASVGRFRIQRETGHHTEALLECRDVIDAWQRAGNWIQLWTTLRNLADLLVELGDDETAHALTAAADASTEAPGIGDDAWQRPSMRRPTEPAGSALTRGEAVTLAVSAIDRHLAHPTEGREP